MQLANVLAQLPHVLTITITSEGADGEPLPGGRTEVFHMAAPGRRGVPVNLRIRDDAARLRVAGIGALDGAGDREAFERLIHGRLERFSAGGLPDTRLRFEDGPPGHPTTYDVEFFV